MTVRKTATFITGPLRTLATEFLNEEPDTSTNPLSHRRMAHAPLTTFRSCGAARLLRFADKQKLAGWVFVDV
jgi:hypothetical protein